MPKKYSFYEIRTRRYHDGASTPPLTVLAESASKAKYLGYWELCECYDNFWDFLRDVYSCKRTWTPRQSVPDDDVARVASRAGLEGVGLNTRVRLPSGREGTIVGTNHSANFNVLLDGNTVPSNIHPGEVTIIL